MKIKMMITVFTPTYNRGALLRRLYDSLLAQTVYGFEWLIVDDDSSDDTESVVQKFIKEEPLQLYHNEIKGVDTIDWKSYPQALIVTDEKLVCDTIEDRLSGIMGLVDHVLE